MFAAFKVSELLPACVSPPVPVMAAPKKSVPCATAFVRLKAVEGLPTMIAKFATDIPKLTNWGEPLLLGPGSIHVAHTPDEKLSKKELLEAVDLYIKTTRNLLR